MSRHLYTFGPFELDTEEQVLRRDGQPLPLKPKVFDLLVVLVENSGRVVCKDELMKQVWGGTFVEEGNLAVSVVKLRQALGESHNERRYIETVPRRGYRFVACVTEEQGDGTDLVAIPAGMPLISGGAAGARKGTIAVLPFKLIGTTGDEYLGLGLADALITRLSNLRQVTVRPTSSIRTYDGAQDPVSAGKELRVEWVLDGSLQKSGRRIRVTVQLVNVVDGVLGWAGKFDEKFTDIFAVEDSISERVVISLAVRLTDKEKSLLAKRYTESAGAYEAYLKGRYFLEKRTTEGCKKAIEYFEQAIAIDPNYALAYTGVAGCYTTLGTIFPSPECNPRAERAALSALQLDAGLSEAHASLGLVKTRQWDWLCAETEFKSAIELNPNNATVHATYAIYLAEVGRASEALREIRTAQALDPISLIINSQLGSLLYLTRRYEEGVQQFHKTLEMDADFAVARFSLGNVYEVQGKYEDALREYQRSQAGLGNLAEFTACVGRIQAFSGRREQALNAIDDLRGLSKVRYVQPTLIALIYGALGDQDEAFRWLEQAYMERDEDLCLLKVDPRLDGLRGDPRFYSLLQRVGLASVDHVASSELLFQSPRPGRLTERKPA
jgi:DNA-binding winged helix-turn-helix (wHTH) protein/TolB-like protein/tetratricopeptide (TPR) repeat protein